MGGAHRPRPAGRGATGCEQSRFRAGARGRPRAPDGRHDDARRALGAARWAGAASARSLLAAHARIPANRPRDVAEDSCRTRRDRAGCSARRADQGRSGAPCRARRRARDRRRLDRLHAGNRRADRRYRQARPRRRRVARPRPRTRRAVLAADRRGRGGGRTRFVSIRASAVRHAGAAATHRDHPRTGERAGYAGRASARTLCMRGAAAGRRDRRLETARWWRRPVDRRRPARFDGHRSRQCRRRGARDRDQPARGD